MVSKVISSAVKSFITIVLFCLIYSYVFDRFINGTAEFLLFLFLLLLPGFLPVYFYKRAGGILSKKSFLLLVFVKSFLLELVVLYYFLKVLYLSEQNLILLALILIVILFVVLLGALLAVFMLYTSRDKRRRIIKYAAIAIPLVALLSFAMLKLFEEPPEQPWQYGLKRLGPEKNSVLYSSGDQVFTVTFMNAVGTAVRLRSITVFETLSNTTCTALITGGKIGQNATTVGSGETFSVSASCPGAGKVKGDPYKMLVAIVYSPVHGGLSLDHVEVGSLFGAVDEPAGSGSYADFNSSSKDAEMCRLFEDDEWMNLCYISMAEVLNDAAICDGLSNESYNGKRAGIKSFRDECYGSLVNVS